jgi:acyl-CoA synthetase (AMP-forming)/AMP-acid ligase II
VRPATRIAVLDKNHDSFFEIWFGVAKAKAVMVPVNWRLAAPEIGYLVSDAQAEVLFVGSEYLDAVAGIRDQLTSVREVIVTNQDYPAWRDRQSATDPQLPTAGSGCKPRGDATLSCRRLALCSGWPLYGRAQCRTARGSAAANLGCNRLLSRDQDVRGASGPSVLLQCAGVPKADLSSLQLIFYGASPIPVELLRNALDVFKCGLAQVYGLTESSRKSLISDPKSIPISTPSACCRVAGHWTASRSA